MRIHLLAALMMPVVSAAAERKEAVPNEPPEYSAAMDLYQARKYREAKAGFIKVKEEFQQLPPVANSAAVLAAFYEMECMRKLGALEELAATYPGFPKQSLTRETQLRQIALYGLWDAVRTQNWVGVEAQAKEWANIRLPGDQRAQVAYCQGLALEGLRRPAEAVFAYQTAMTADSGASEEIARQAALRVLTIHAADPEVQAALRLGKSRNANENSKGSARLAEAAGVARLFEMSLGAGTPLPAGFRVFLKDAD